MALKVLNLDSAEISKKKTLLVDVPQFKGQVLMTQLTVSGYIRRNNLYRKIAELKDISDERRTGLMICAQIISTMICDETGDFLVNEDQLDKFHDTLTRETFENLMLANAELNPISDDVDLSLEEKKTES